MMQYTNTIRVNEGDSENRQIKSMHNLPSVLVQQRGTLNKIKCLRLFQGRWGVEE